VKNEKAGSLLQVLVMIREECIFLGFRSASLKMMANFVLSLRRC
jgi:hypothetical protein